MQAKWVIIERQESCVRAFDPGGWWFESVRARHFHPVSGGRGLRIQRPRLTNKSYPI